MGSGRLTTHVLDTARGKPASGITIALFHIVGAERIAIGTAVTNADGRTDAPMLAGDQMAEGHYELVFSVGDYLRQSGQNTGDILFLEDVPIRFGVPDRAQHYHVPLLISPFGYSTYRGS